MKRISTNLAVLGLSLAVAAPLAAQDNAQLIAAGGISRAEAQDLTLNEIAAYLFNRSADSDDRQPVIDRSGPVMVDPARHGQLIAAAGMTPDEARGMTLGELAAARHNAGARRDEQQPPVENGGTAKAGAQLVAAAGLSPAEAADMTLTEVAAAKFNREARTDDRQAAY